MEFDRQSLNSGKHKFERPGSDIKMTGYLKKLKTMKKKYFVLRCTSSSGPARLEYYDSEKKFKAGHLPKRTIHLHTCFNINKKSDSRHGKHGITLYSSEECLTILTDSERDQDTWLGIILEYQNEYLPDGDMHKERYEHVWQVTLLPRGLCQGKGYKGNYRLCLNRSTVSLVKVNSSLPQFTIQLVTIRNLAYYENSFRLEVGNYAPTGAGEFWFTLDDSISVKDLHKTLLQYMNDIENDPSFRRDQRSSHSRSNRDVHSQPVAYNSNSSVDGLSPCSPNYPGEYPIGGRHIRSESRASRNSSKLSFHEDISPGFITGYNEDQLDGGIKEHCSIVPPDMSPPPSPSCLDEETNAYLAMDIEKSKQRCSLSSMSSPNSQPSTYLAMGYDQQGSSHRGEMSNSYTDDSSPGYMAMAGHNTVPASHPIPIHAHSFSEPMHTSHLPTVREGGSNEGYLPMDSPSSLTSTSIIPRPEPAVCMLSDSSTGLPPRTYSLGSKPTKISSYVEMGDLKKGAGNDMSRATSAPHILKGRKYREQRTESPTPSASPLSVSLKSDDSESFIDYIPMRPRTSSDSFNYRNRTSSFGKTQQSCRPRSSSHGQGTRPIINFTKLNVEKSRISHESSQRTSRESSLQGSFDSLRVSSESLRRMSQDMRQASGSNASDYTEMRGTPSPQMKSGKSDSTGYMSMQVGTSGRKPSPHRVRTDSSGSGRHNVKSNSSDRLHQQQTHQQHGSDYTEMVPHGHGTGNSGDSYINMDLNLRHNSSSDSKNVALSPQMHSSQHEDSSYMNMELDDKVKTSGGNRSVSAENVDTYIMFESQSGGNKPRTGSLGSKDKSVSRPISTRKSSSASMSSASSPSTSGTLYHHNQPSISTSTRSGGSSDSIKRTMRQSSMEKYGSLGKDFRKKSGSTGSRPNAGKSVAGMSVVKDHDPSESLKGMSSSMHHHTDEADDEYIIFTPPATKHENQPHQVQAAVFSHPGSSHGSTTGRSSSSLSSGSTGSTRANMTPSPADDNAYTVFSPAAAKTVHFQQQHQQHHHNHPTKLGTSPNSSQIREVLHKEKFEKTEYELMAPTSSKQTPSKENADYELMSSTSVSPSVTSAHSFRHTKQVQAKSEPAYVGFEPPGGSSIKAPTQLSLTQQANHGKHSADFLRSKPSTQTAPSKPLTPTSAVSYILSDDNIRSADSHTPDGRNKAPGNDHRQNEPCSNPISTALSQHRSQSKSPVIPLPRSPSQPTNTLDPELTKPLGTSRSLSLNQDSIDAQNKKLSNPNTSDSEHPRSSKSIIQDKPTTSSIGNQKAQLTQLYIDVGEEHKNISQAVKSSNVGGATRDQNLQHHLKLQQSPQNLLRQLSAPASQSSPVMTPIPESHAQPNSPQPKSPDVFSYGKNRHKHLSDSSAMGSSSPTGFGSKFKPWGGSSKSSRKSSSDSEKSFHKGKKSDTFTNSSGINKKLIQDDCRLQDCHNLQPQKYNDHSPMDISFLEAKMITAEAKIRNNSGDNPVARVTKKYNPQHGLVRPDSTPCIQNLAPVVDQGSWSVGDTPSSTSRSGTIQFSVGPRSRHSLSDLCAYQQMNINSSPGVGQSNCDPGKNAGSINENSLEQFSKPLNYVKLDLSCQDNQGDTDGKSSRTKSRNSSDADDKPPPLSYAEIDFVRSQCRSKLLPIGISGDAPSSKT